MPIGSLYAAYATSTNPFGSELDGTAADYGGRSSKCPTSLGRSEQGRRNRHQVGAVRSPPAGDRRAVPYREGQCARDRRRRSASGAAYQVEGIDLEVSGKITDRWSVFGGLVLMRSKVTQSALASNIGLQMANIAHESFSMLTKYKFDGGWELGGQAVYRSKIYGGTFGANTGTELPSYWRFDAFVEKKIDKNWTMKLYAQNLTNKLYYDTLYRSATPFVAVAPGRAFYVVTLGEVLIVLICVPEVLSKDDVADFRRIMDASDWEDGRSTAGAQSALVKSNEQLAAGQRGRAQLGNRMVSALTASPRFISAAIPLQIFPPLFNRYAPPTGTISASTSTTP